MKCLISLLLTLILVFSVFGCTPDNIVTPSPDEGGDSQNTGTDTPVTDNTNGENGDTNQELTEKTAPNTGVMPSFDIDSLSYVNLKSSDYKDKGITLYVGSSAFTAGDNNETAWMDALAKDYGFTAEYKICSDAALYSSQLIAQKSGFGLDVISAKVEDVFSALSLMKPADSLITETENDPFSSRVFRLSKNRLFAGKGNAKMLWYNTAIVTQTPADTWTFEDFVKIADSVKEKDLGVLENDSFVEFMNTGKDRITGIDQDGNYVMKAQDKTARDILAAFAKTVLLSEEKAEDKKFSRENVAFIYTDTPATKRNMTVNWAPLPKYGEEGTNAVALCGSGLGISKTVTDENLDSALAFIMLWCARATESREDTLRFSLSLSKASCEQYIKMCEEKGEIYAADREINDCFEGGGFPEIYFADDPYNGVDPKFSSVFYTVPSAYGRAKLLTLRK